MAASKKPRKSSKKRATGRPSKLTPEMQRKIIEAVESGIQPDAAAAEAGIAPSTYFDWMSRGASDEEPFATFRSEVARAKLSAEAKLTRDLLDGDDRGISFGPAKAALELLSRIRPERYSASMKVQLRDDLERILGVVERVCGRESFLAVLEALAHEDSGGVASETPRPGNQIH